jgi:hypothetical protein
MHSAYRHRMRYAVLALIVACGAPAPPATVSASPPTGGAGPSSASPHWLQETSVPAGPLGSPAPGDIWAGKFHRVNGHWVLAARVSGDKTWIASPDQVWALESATSVLHHWTSSNDVVTDLARPNRLYTAINDGWIAYMNPATEGCAHCDAGIGFLRIDDGGFTDIPVPAAKWRIESILRDVAVTVGGEVLSYDGTQWTITRRIDGGGPISLSLYEGLCGTSAQDLYVLGGFRGFHSFHFDGTIWREFALDGLRATSIWVTPAGPQWAMNEGGDVFELVGTDWVNRGAAPWDPAQIASDGRDVFASTPNGIYRYIP